MAIPSEGLEALMDIMDMIAETTVGYRKKLIDGGCSVELAETMTKEFHDMLVATAGAAASAQLTKGGGRR